MIGTDDDLLQKWFRFQLKPEHTLDDIGKTLHIDHVRPISIFSEEDKIMANHWSNLQPLPANENLSKSNKIDIDMIAKQSIKAKFFNDNIVKYELL